MNELQGILAEQGWEGVLEHILRNPVDVYGLNSGTLNASVYFKRRKLELKGEHGKDDTIRGHSSPVP